LQIIYRKRETSERCPSPRQSAKVTQLPAQMLKRWWAVCNICRCDRLEIWSPDLPDAS